VDVFAEGTLGGLSGINARTMRGQRGNHMQRRGGRAGAYPLALGVASTSNGTIAGDAYWDIQTTQATRDVYSGTGTSAAKGVTTAQMISPSSFRLTYDFSSAAVWAMPAGATHPLLRRQLAQ
jgi:hypothetical protein